MVRILGFIFIIVVLSQAVGVEAAPRPARVTPGYLESLDGERASSEAGEISIPPNPEAKEPPLSSRIFNEQLTKEFNDGYRQAFGETEAEQNYNQPSRITFANMDSGPSSTATADETKRQEFGQYMLRRLAEYHVDNYAKNDPGVRPAYQMKERVSNVKAEVAPGYSVTGKYLISGNMYETKLENPYLRSQATVEFGNTGPSHHSEVTYNLGRDVTKTISVDSYYRQNMDQVSLVTRKKLAPGMVGSIEGRATGKHDAYGNDGEKLALVGLSWNY